LHEEMISPDDSRRTLKLGNRFVVMPIVAEWGYKAPKGESVVDGFSYRSDNNDLWLTPIQLIEMITTIEKSDQ
jgi:UDP-N-acetylglucosamine 4,6-dehydratase